MNDSLDRQALLDTGLDPDDPVEWQAQRRIQQILADIAALWRADQCARLLHWLLVEGQQPAGQSS